MIKFEELTVEQKNKLRTRMSELFGNDIFITTRIVPETLEDYSLCQEDYELVDIFISEIYSEIWGVNR